MCRIISNEKNYQAHIKGKVRKATSLKIISATNSRGRFHQHLHPTFARKQNEKLILANVVWRMAHRFGKRGTYFSLVFRAGLKRQLLVKLNGEFFAERYAPASFRLANKVW